MTATLPPPADPVTEAQLRQAELYESWITRPQNYRPPPWAPREAHDEHRARWERSAEFAHAQQLLRNAQS